MCKCWARPGAWHRHTQTHYHTQQGSRPLSPPSPQALAEGCWVFAPPCPPQQVTAARSHPSGLSRGAGRLVSTGQSGNDLSRTRGASRREGERALPLVMPQRRRPSGQGHGGPSAARVSQGQQAEQRKCCCLLEAEDIWERGWHFTQKRGRRELAGKSGGKLGRSLCPSLRAFEGWA